MDIRDLIELLTVGRNPDGGWGYYRHKNSRLEATCWAVLGLTSTSDGATIGEALKQWPSRDGLLLERAGGEPNHGFQGLLEKLAQGGRFAGGGRTSSGPREGLGTFTSFRTLKALNKYTSPIVSGERYCACSSYGRGRSAELPKIQIHQPANRVVRILCEVVVKRNGHNEWIAISRQAAVPVRR